MGIQIASVSIGTKLDLTGFNQGLGSISSMQAPTASVRVKIDASSIEKERQRLEKLLSKNLTIKVRADHSELYELNKHIELKRNHVRDVNSWMSKNPIKVKVDDSELRAVPSNKKITVSTNYQSSSNGGANSSNAGNKYNNDECCDFSDVTSAIDSLESTVEKGLKSQKKGFFGEIRTGYLENIGRNLSSTINNAALKTISTVGNVSKSYVQAATTVNNIKAQQELKKPSTRQEQSVASKNVEQQQKETLRQEMLAMNRKQALEPLAQQLGIKNSRNMSGGKKQLVDEILAKAQVPDIKTKLPYVDNIAQDSAKQAQKLVQQSSDSLALGFKQSIKGYSVTLKNLKGSGNKAEIQKLGNDVEGKYKELLTVLNSGIDVDVKKTLEGAKLQLGKVRKAVSKEQSKITNEQVSKNTVNNNTQQQFLRRGRKDLNPLQQRRLEQIEFNKRLVDERAEQLYKTIPDLPEGTKRIALVSGGFAGKRGESSKGIAERMQPFLGEETFVQPVKNFDTDDDVDYDQPGLGKAKWFKHVGKIFARHNLQKGYKEDALEAAAYAQAYARKAKDQGIKVPHIEGYGYSSGGYLMQEVAELSRGKTPFKGVGIGTPHYNLSNTASQEDYISLLGNQDPLWTLQGKRESPNLRRYENAGKKHVLENYTKNANVQRDIAAHMGQETPFVLGNQFEETMFSALNSGQEYLQLNPKMRTGIKATGAIEGVLNEIAEHRQTIADQIDNISEELLEDVTSADEMLAHMEEMLASSFDITEREVKPLAKQAPLDKRQAKLLAEKDKQEKASAEKQKFLDEYTNKTQQAKEAGKNLASKIGKKSPDVKTQNDFTSYVGLSSQQAKHLETNYKNTFKEVANISNFDIAGKELPGLKVDDKLLKEQAADALYDIEHNQIIISKELQKALAQNPHALEQYAEQMKALVHEARHALQFDLGTLTMKDLELGIKPGTKLKSFAQTSPMAQKSALDSLDYAKQNNPAMSARSQSVLATVEADASDFEDNTPNIIDNLRASDTFENAFGDFKQEKAAFQKALDDIEALLSDGLNHITKSITNFAKDLSKKAQTLISGFLTGNLTKKETANSSYAYQYVRRGKAGNTVLNEENSMPDPWEVQESEYRKATVVSGTTSSQFARKDPRTFRQQVQNQANKKIVNPLAQSLESSKNAAEQATESFNNRLENHVKDNTKRILKEVAKMSGIEFDESDLPEVKVDNSVLKTYGKEAVLDIEKNQILITSRIRNLLQNNPKALAQFAQQLKPLVEASKQKVDPKNTQQEVEKFLSRNNEVLARVETTAKGERSNYAPIIKGMADNFDAAIDAMALGKKESENLKKKARLYLESLRQAAKTPNNLPEQPKSSDLQKLGIAHQVSRSAINRTINPDSLLPENNTPQRLFNKVVPLKVRRKFVEKQAEGQAAYMANPNTPKNIFQAGDMFSQKFKVPIELYAKLNIKGITDVLQDLQKHLGKGLDQLQEKAAALPYFGDMAQKAVGGLKLFNIAGGGAVIVALRFLTVFTRVGALVTMAQTLALVTARFDQLRKTFELTADKGGRSTEVFERVMQKASDMRLDKTMVAEGATEIFGNLKNKGGGQLAEKTTKTASETAAIYGSDPASTQKIFSSFGQLTQQATLSIGDFQQLANTIPGSMDTVARSMGMTTAEFQNFIQTNQVLTEDLMPRLMQQMDAENQSKLPAAMDTITAATNRYNNALLDTQMAGGKVFVPFEKARINIIAGGLETVGKKAAEVMAHWSVAMAGLGIVKFGVALKNVVAAILPFILNSSLLQGVLGGLMVILKGAIPVIMKMGAEFLLFQLAIDAVMVTIKAFQSAGGVFTEWADKSVARVDALTLSFDKASKGAKELQSALPKDEKDLNATGSRFGDTLIGTIFGKKNVQWAEKGMDSALQKIDPTWKSYAQKELYDKEVGISTLRESGGAINQKVLDLRQGVDPTLKNFVANEKELEKVKAKRKALITTSPDDTVGLRKLRDEEKGLLKKKDIVGAPIAQLQGDLAAQIKTYEDALEKIEDESKKGAWTQEAYQRATQGLKADLQEAEKAQSYLNKQIKDSSTALLAMQRNFARVNAELADGNSALTKSNNEFLTTLANKEANGTYSSQQSGFIKQAQDQNMLAEKIKLNKQASIELQESLASQGGEETLSNYNISLKETGSEQLGVMAKRAETSGNSKEQEIFTQYQRVKELELETSDLEAQSAQKRADMASQVKELNKQINEYYRGITRQFVESTIQFKQQSSQLQTQSYATELKGAISDFSDNIVSTFVDNILESIQQLADAADKKFDVDTAVLQANNQFEDAIRQGDELKRQLPKYELVNSDVPSIPVTLDFSTVGKDADLSKLNNEIGKAVDNTQELTNLTGSYPGLINESVSATQDWDSANSDVVSTIQSLDFDLNNTNESIQGNINSANELITSFDNNVVSSLELGGQININTASLQDNNSAVLDVDSSLNTAIKTTANVNSATTSWLGTTGQISTEINTNVSSGLGNVTGSIEGITNKTVDWFKTFANNIPILNQLGQIFAGWGQQLAGIGQTIAGFGQGGIEESVKGSTGAIVASTSAMLAGMGKGVGNVGKYEIFDSNYGHNVSSYEKLSRHHALRGIENKDYGNHGGKQEEVRKTSDGRELVKKDFVLERNGSSAVDIPAMASGYIQRMNDATDGVRIYADKAMTKLLGQSLHMKNINVKDGDFVQYGQRIGTQGDTGSPGAIHAHIEMEINAFKQYIQDLKDGVFEGSQPTSVTEQKHSLGDGHNHYGEDDAKAVNQKLAAGIPAQGTMQLSNAGSPNKGADQFVGAVLSILEAPTRQGRVDVAQVISNRVGNNFGGYGANIRDQGFASGQFQPFFKETYGIGKNDIRDQASAITALKKAGYSTEQATTALNNFWADINDAAKVADSQSKVAGRAYFKGTTQQGNMRGDDFLRNKNENFFHYEDSDPNRKVKAIKDVFGGASALNNMNVTANVQPTGSVNNWQPVATPGVWTPKGVVGGNGLSQVSAKGNEAISKATGIAEIQRARQIELAEKKASNEAASATATALRSSNRAFKELEKGLRENGLKVTSLGDEVTDTNLEYKGALDTEQQRQKAQRDLDKKYGALENELVSQRKEIESQVESAKTILGKGGIVSPEMKGKVQSLIDNPNIKENLREQLRASLSSGALGDGGKELLQRAMTEGQGQLSKLDTSLTAVRKGRGESKTSLDEKFAREEKLRKQNASFDIESASIDTLKAKLEQLQAVQSRSPFAPEVKAIPSIQNVIAAREEQLKLEQKLKEIDEKEKAKTYTKSEADTLRKEVVERKKIVDITIKQNSTQAELVMKREQDNRNREAANELAQVELGKDKQRLEQLKLIAQTAPLSPELSGNAIPELERKISLKEAELKLTQDIAAIEQEGFENKRTPEEVAKKKADTTSAYETQIKNINTQSEQAVFANEISQQKTLLEIKKQQLDYQTSIVEATSRAINLGIKQGDPLKLSYDAQRSQMQLSVESQVLEMKEFANKTGKSKEEVIALEKQIRDLNGINLDNLAAEFQKSVSDRAFGIRQRLGSSGTELLESQASFYSGRGMNFKAQSLQRQSAMVQQQSSYEGQKRDLEEFIKTNQVASDAAQQLRDNLEAVNQVKFDTIKDNFNTFKPVIDSVGTAIEDGLVNVFKTGKFDVNAFFDTIFSSMAKLAASWIKEQLLGSIMGGGKNKGKGGMFAEDKKSDNPQDPLTALISGDKSSSVGLSPVAPMYVNVVNSNAFGSGFSGVTGASPMSDLFGLGNTQVNSGNDFLSSIFSGEASFDKSNPFPVGIEKSAPNAFSSLAGTISGIFGGSGGASGGGLGGILGSVTGLLGGGGGLGGILGMIMPLFGGLFAEGGVIGGSARSPKDDQLILAQKGEGILTHKGMDAIGGGAVLGAINDGRINLPKFAEGGVVGSGYISNTGEYGSSRTTDKVAGRASEPREVNVKMETTSINGVEYLTKEQGQELAQKAAQEGAKNGATYVQDKLMNSVAFRNRLGVR